MPHCLRGVPDRHVFSWRVELVKPLGNVVVLESRDLAHHGERKKAELRRESKNFDQTFLGMIRCDPIGLGPLK